MLSCELWPPQAQTQVVRVPVLVSTQACMCHVQRGQDTENAEANDYIRHRENMPATHKPQSSHVVWHIPTIPTLERPKQEE